MPAIRRLPAVLLLGFLVDPAAHVRSQDGIPDPTAHFGFELGSDGNLASWDALVAWYDALGAASDRVVVQHLGESTLGNPFLLVVISAPENLARLERLAEVSRRLADPRGLDDGAVDALVAEGRAVVAVTVGLHSTEVAATQMAPRLAHRLASSDDAATAQVLRETVFLLFPCFNPDGTQMVVEWNEQTRGTKYQGSRPPDLYHWYAGHDNNRDAYALNLPESRHFAGIVYKKWVPQAFLDVHQMGSYGARLYVPPYADPVNPGVDPLIWLEHELFGAHMQVALEREDVHGVVAGSPFTGWWFPSFHMVTNHHNIAGMLTETASCRGAWPLYVHPHQLRPHGRGHDVYGPMQIFPHPWPGGWWRLAELIRQQEISTFSLLETAARHRELLLRNMVFKARRTIEQGGTEAPFAFVVPAVQHDSLTVGKLIATLVANGIEVDRATEDFLLGDRLYRAGDFVVSCAQPNGRLVRSLLGQAHYPDNAVTRRADGSIQRPYDMAQFVLAEHMGVRAEPAATPVQVAVERIVPPVTPAGSVTGSAWGGWLVSHAPNDVFLLTQRLLEEGIDVHWLKNPTEAGGQRFAPGALWVPPEMSAVALVEQAARDYGLDAVGLDAPPSGPALQLRPLRLGIYRRYDGGNKDEGWTRLLLDSWGIPYQRVDADAMAGGALDQLDVLVIPQDGLERLLQDGATKEGEEPREEEYPEVLLPPAWKKGLTAQHVDALRAFAQRGGTLILLDQACALASERLGIPVRNVVEELPTSEFFCPGSTLRARYDVAHPLCYGMPEEGLLLHWNSPVFAVRGSALNEQIAAPVTYARENLLRSGWLIGEEVLTGMPAAVVASYGAGRIVLLGFRAQHRAQTHGTFKILFNALYWGTAEEVEL